MFNLLSTIMSGKTTPKYIEGIPPQFLMTKEEMQEDLMHDYMQPDSDMSWDDLLDQMNEIDLMFDDEV